ncbi:MAG: hypothetical protein NPIRA06_23480 [Nitrospirales bacterium]|nr:MAG: hypothetical protein NPIRA06_23480 [Nitrospirales bacterium]
MFLSGCFTVGAENVTGERGDQSLAFGGIDIEIIGPNPRQFPTRLRFFDVIDVSTQERTRVMVEAETQTFSVSLLPGHYEVIRLQFNEGPFRAEVSVTMRFHIPANQLTYLGTWQLKVDTPRTQRMVRMEIPEKNPNWGAVFEADPILKGKFVVNSFPQLSTHKTRLFVVSPIPKVPYFYR